MTPPPTPPPRDPDIRITLRPKPDAVPSNIRLRRLLKLALRAFGLVCVDVREVPAETPK
jgi:hypothetical protein